jgi:ABC-type transport system substrate-binding protein
MIGRRALLAATGALPALAAAADAGERGAPKTLHLALAAPETSLDPPQTNSDYYSNSVLGQILEAPLCYDYLARPARLLPNTALALPELSADLRRITLRIRPGIFFTDDPAFKGARRELVAADYAYAIKRYYDPRWNASDLHLFESAGLLGLPALREQALRTRRPFDYDAAVEGARALDRHTLELNFNQASPRFVYLLASTPLLGAVAREVVEHYGDEIGAHPVGTGAFRLAQWRRGSRIVLERSPGYRGSVYNGQPADLPVARAIAARLAGRRLPLVDRIEFDVIDEAQPRWLSFLNGRLDRLEVPGSFASLAVPGGQLAPFLRRKGVRLELSLQPAMSMTYFNCRDPVIGGYAPERVALRRALALAYPSGEWARLLRGGLAIAAQSVIAPFTSGYDAAYRSEMSEHSPVKARAMLDLYGYADRNGDGWREQPDGAPLRLRIASRTGALGRLENEIWKRALDAIGVQVEFDSASWPDLLKRARVGALMIWGYSWTTGTPDGGFFLGLAYGPHAEEVNDAHFELPAYDRLFERQRALPDGAAREALMTEAKNLLVAYMPYKVHGHSIAADLSQHWTHNDWRHPYMTDVYRFVDVDPH